MLPLAATTCRSKWFAVSEITTFPVTSTNTPRRQENLAAGACVAEGYCRRSCKILNNSRRLLNLPKLVVIVIRDINISRAIQRNAQWIVKHSRCSQAAVAPKSRYAVRSRNGVDGRAHHFANHLIA